MSSDSNSVVPWWHVWLIGFLAISLVGQLVRPMVDPPLPPRSNASVARLDAEPRQLTVLVPSVTAARIYRKSERADRALGELDALLMERSDLQQAFGTNANTNLKALVDWAITNADSGTFRLAPHRNGLLEVQKFLSENS